MTQKATFLLPLQDVLGHLVQSQLRQNYLCQFSRSEDETVLSSEAVVPKVCSAGSKGSANSSEGNRGHIYVLSTLEFIFFVFSRGIMFC